MGRSIGRYPPHPMDRVEVDRSIEEHVAAIWAELDAIAAHGDGAMTAIGWRDHLRSLKISPGLIEQIAVLEGWDV